MVGFAAKSSVVDGRLTYYNTVMLNFAIELFQYFKINKNTEINK